MSIYVEEKEKPAMKRMGVFLEETVLTPEMRQFIEEYIDKKVKETMGLSPAKMMQQKRITIMRTRYFYDVWVGLLSFITFISVYFTAMSFLSLIPGILVTLASIATLILFVISR